MEYSESSGKRAVHSDTGIPKKEDILPIKNVTLHFRELEEQQ